MLDRIRSLPSAHCGGRVGRLASTSGCLFAVALTSASLAGSPAPVTFQFRTIETAAVLWWARALGDVNGGGRTDILLQDNNGHGGMLRWYETGAGGEAWTPHLIAERAPSGSPFAADDLGAADIFRLPSHDATRFEVLVRLP